MKKMFLLSVFASLLMACDYSYTEKYTYQINEPVFMPEAAFRSSVKVTKEKREISNYGKICFYNGYLFISESEVGVHIPDNRNPSQPNHVGFIELSGNADIAIKDNRLYADSCIDLVWFGLIFPTLPIPNWQAVWKMLSLNPCQSLTIITAMITAWFTGKRKAELLSAGL